ncbi:bestrophin family protein [Aureibacter tunicatorum]|uniref:Membrane protein n=1 Tax=Aureibacter tunicatorum TaxID=866807 RepID=A0AAE4BR50_9BACT|nr:bestrophin family ion channel [Aureibacter tunicatorum]MDR6237583.1 putative membrane protein [Aureibacter tunicatorum]BDD02617.1 membrane protein [Aureibacter tunicatorum]
MLLKKGIPYSYLFGIIKVEIAYVAIFMILFFSFHNFFASEYSIPLAIPGVLGTSISLILGFRTSQAYSRWWEARIVWGAIVNDSRALVRELACFTNVAEVKTPKSRIDEIVNLQIAWCHLLGQSLRKRIEPEYWESYLDQEQKERLEVHDNKPNLLLLMISEKIHLLKKGNHINYYHQVQMDWTVNRLSESMGKCERIKNTVFPTTYCMMVHIFIYAFIFVLPFGLAKTMGWEMYPLIFGVACIFFLIEKIGMQLQDPFENSGTDTPMTSLARTIERNVLQMTNREKIPAPITSDTFFIN